MVVVKAKIRREYFHVDIEANCVPLNLEGIGDVPLVVLLVVSLLLIIIRQNRCTGDDCSRKTVQLISSLEGFSKIHKVEKKKLRITVRA